MTDTIQLFDLTANVSRALLWQYNQALRLQSIVESEQAWYNENQTQFWSNWYEDVFNLQTANDFGCVVWSIILDLPLIVSSGPVDPEEVRWGYGEYRENYNNGNFAPAGGGFQTLTVEQARTVLKMRYFQLTSRGTVPEINFFLKTLFAEEGNAYVIDNGDMTAEYVFEFPLSPKIFFIFENNDILPRPAGVSLTYTFDF